MGVTSHARDNLAWMTVQSSRQGHPLNPIHATSHDECMRPKARLTVELGEFQAKLPREPSPIEGTPSKTPRRTELKSRELQANDEEDRMQEDCKSRELQANDKEDRTQEDCNTQARCRLRGCRWCSWWCCPGAAAGAAPGSGFSLLRAVWCRPGRPPSPSQPPASRRRPSRAEHGLKLETNPDRAERGKI